MTDALWVIVVPVVVLGIAVMISHNRFVAQRAGVESTWAGVDVQLQRRHDLVPNLVRSVRAYADHEREVIEQVTTARQAAVTADNDPGAGPLEQARHEGRLTDATHDLLAVAERYPQLQAASEFQRLQAQLIETEDRIAAARRLYNLEVRALNRRIEAFPSNIVASVFRFPRAEYFQLTDAGPAVPPTVHV